jgi:hypothetical protein
MYPTTTVNVVSNSQKVRIAADGEIASTMECRHHSLCDGLGGRMLSMLDSCARPSTLLECFRLIYL